MLDQQKFYDATLGANAAGTLLGASLLRDVLLPQMIGEDKAILYWGGKKLARQFVLAKDEDIAPFFLQAGWGQLTRVKAKRNQQEFHLEGEVISNRMKSGATPDFVLEAGFLAETIQNQLGFTAEAVVTKTDERKGIVTILVQLDHKDPIDIDANAATTPLTLRPLPTPAAETPAAPEEDQAEDEIK